MDQRVRLVTLGVTDVNRAWDFYQAMAEDPDGLRCLCRRVLVADAGPPPLRDRLPGHRLTGRRRCAGCRNATTAEVKRAEPAPTR